MAFRPGERAGNYTIKSIIGSGGMSIVYEAVDDNGQTVALKVLADNLAANPRTLDRFEREADVLRRLKHRHVVQVLDTFTVEDVPCMVMQFMAGGSLARRLQLQPHMTLGESARIIQQIAQGLDYAHRQHIIHRDIKLENILLTEDMQVALGDFGLARALDEEALTTTGTLLGTPYYMSPEQIQPTKSEVDYRADLYALGVLGYALATGQYPFYSREAAAVLNHHLLTPPPPPTELNPELPPELNYVLMRAIAKDPDTRYANAGQFADEFMQAVAEHEAQSVHVGVTGNPSSTPASPGVSKPKRTPLPQPAPQRTTPFTTWTTLGLLVIGLVLRQGLIAINRNEALNETIVITATFAPTTPPLPTATNTPQPAICTDGGGDPLEMTLINNTPYEVDAYWIDTDCSENYWITLPGGVTGVIQGFTLEGWVILDAETDTVVREFITSKDVTEYYVSEADTNIVLMTSTPYATPFPGTRYTITFINNNSYSTTVWMDDTMLVTITPYSKGQALVDPGKHSFKLCDTGYVGEDFCFGDWIIDMYGDTEWDITD